MREETGLIALEAGAFRLTGSGERAASDLLLLHRLLLEAMLTQIEWRYGRRIPTIAPLQDGAGFLLYVSWKLSGRRSGPRRRPSIIELTTRGPRVTLGVWKIS